MRRTLGMHVLLASVLLLAACKTGEIATQSGVMAGQWTPPGGDSQIVTLSWEAFGDADDGPLHLTLGRGGSHFRGHWQQVLDASLSERVATVLIPWPLDARAEDPALDWGIRAPAPGEPLRYTYLSRDLSGHVVASLATGVESGALAAADTIRCRFELADPSRGLVGGGRGSCTVSDGGRIDVQF